MRCFHVYRKLMFINFHKITIRWEPFALAQRYSIACSRIKQTKKWYCNVINDKLSSWFIGCYQTLFSDFRPTSMEKGQELVRMRIYNVYAWGMPIIITTVAAILDNLPESSAETFLRPRFGENKCWFYGESLLPRNIPKNLVNLC